MKTYTDDEIVRAWECCFENNCVECPCYSDLDCDDVVNDKDLLNIVKRQQAEIARLETECNDKERAYTDEYCLRKEWQSKCSELLQAKSETIKEFAQRLKEMSEHFEMERENFVSEEDIDNLVKEMTEGGDE